jgi:demethylmenaquinone methyltransferase/2-methoxy-6-polyprenyl-1,4-benzoquinol methylase
VDRSDEEIVAEQIRYYDRRAPIYEQLYRREGRYALEDRGAAETWRRETRALERFVRSLGPASAVLELACGTGLWTRLLAPRAGRMLAVDAAAGMIERNRAAVADDRVRYEQADLFAWTQQERFGLVFAGFFLSHIPPDRWLPFWRKVAGWVAPGGVIAFADDAWGPDRPRSSQRVPGGPDYAHVRSLHDEEYVIVKRFFRPQELEAALAETGIEATVETTGEHFLYGTARPLASA